MIICMFIDKSSSSKCRCVKHHHLIISNKNLHIHNIVLRNRQGGERERGREVVEKGLRMPNKTCVLYHFKLIC